MKQPGERSPAPTALLAAQDLANTADLEAGLDDLGTPADLGRWARDHGLHGLSFDDADLAGAKEFREALRDTCLTHTGAALPRDSAKALERHLCGAPLVLAFDDSATPSLQPAPGLQGAAAVVALVAAGISTAAADGTWPRLKACASHSCRWVYYDRSPGGRSRWCTMAICGSRAKMRAYRSRAGA